MHKGTKLELSWAVLFCYLPSAITTADGQNYQAAAWSTFFGHGDRSADSERNIESVTEKCKSATTVEMLEAFEAGIVTV